MPDIGWKRVESAWIAHHRELPIARVESKPTPDGCQLHVTLLEWPVPGYWRPGQTDYLSEVEVVLKRMINAVMG